jgi:hypothetical protein
MTPEGAKWEHDLTIFGLVIIHYNIIAEFILETGNSSWTGNLSMSKVKIKTWEIKISKTLRYHGATLIFF